MKNKTIAYLFPGIAISGGVAVLFQHLNRLRLRGYDVKAYVQGMTIDQCKVVDTSWFPNQSIEILSLEEYEPVDFLVATGWTTAFDVANLPAKRKGYFVQSDETRFFEKNSPEFHLANVTYLMDFEFFTEAKWIQKWLKEKFNKDSGYVPNGLDENIFHPITPLEAKGRKFRVLLEGAIDIPFKGMADSFAAVDDLDVEVWCISNAGKPREGWKCDKFFECVDMADMKRIYSSCDALVKMSRVEGFFGPPLEMMACGGVSVVAEVSGYDEYITAGENALVVSPGDVQGVKSALKSLMNDVSLREKIIKNGKVTADTWSWDRSIDHLEDYLQLVDKKEVVETTDPGKSLAFLYYQFHEKQALANRLGGLEAHANHLQNVVSENENTKQELSHFKRRYNVVENLAGNRHLKRMAKISKGFMEKVLGDGGLFNYSPSTADQVEFIINRNREFNKKKPVFSVIIPIYNRTDELRQAIESILSQSFRNFELLLLCDGSPQETLDVVKEYESNPHVRVFKYPDSSGNACRCRNKGIEIAKGDIVAFLDSDDMAYPDRLYRSLYLMLERNVDFVSGAVEYLVDGSRVINGIENGQIGYPAEYSFEVTKELNGISTCTVAVKREQLLAHGSFRLEMRYREDHELWLRLAYRGCKIFNSREIFSKYRVHADNAELKYLEKDAHWKALTHEMYDKPYESK